MARAKKVDDEQEEKLEEDEEAKEVDCDGRRHVYRSEPFDLFLEEENAIVADQ